MVEQWLYELGQQPEALDDDALIGRELQQVFDDEAKTFAPEPVKGFKHGLRRAIDPPLVHAHFLKLSEEWTVFRATPRRVVRRRIVRRIEPQAMLGREAASDRRLARAATAADPIHVPQPAAQ